MIEVLAIDDEPMNLMMLEEYLEGEGYHLTTVERARAGLDHLEAGHKVRAILLDRMMPGMDGMEFLSIVKSRDEFRNIPVIMQTAAVTPQQIAEGIEAGVFYYLTKPFKRNALLSVLRNALQDFAIYDAVQSELAILNESLQKIDACTLTVRTLADVNSVSVLVSRLFPEPSNVALGVRELLLNGVEHGNAGVTYDEKTALNAAGRWEEEVGRRLDLPENRHKRVTAQFRRAVDTIELVIEDEGPGFDWAAYLEIDPARILDNHGRGIAMSKIMSFDSVEYVAPGNKVVCKKRLA